MSVLEERASRAVQRSEPGQRRARQAEQGALGVGLAHLFSPMHMFSRPSSQLRHSWLESAPAPAPRVATHARQGSTNPLMTWPAPSLKLKGVPRS